MTDKIISKPVEDSEGENRDHKFGYCEVKGWRNTQEDALAWEVLASDLFQNSSPAQIGNRIWTAYQNLSDHLFELFKIDAGMQEQGTTASTTVMFGDYIVTATLADTVAFAAIYDADGRVVKVHRLNERIHTPISEQERITARGGFICQRRVFGTLAVSRAIGDYEISQSRIDDKGKVRDSLLGEAPIIAPDADIDIWSLASVPKQYKVQIITTCDGFTESATSRKIDHAKYLMNFLNKMNNNHPGQLSESDIAKQLVSDALEDHSKDNISVSVQTKSANFTGMTGIYDGHGGTKCSHYVADNIGAELTRLLMLNEAQYEQEKNSVTNRRNDYERDNGECRNIFHDLGRDLPSPVADSSGAKYGSAGDPTFLAYKAPGQGERKGNDLEDNETNKPGGNSPGTSS